MIPAPPLVPVETARAALTSARRYRAEWLMALAAGTVTTMDLLQQAATTQGRPLARLGLRQILGATPGNGDATVRRKLALLADECGCPGLQVSRMTVGWLLDNRTQGRRFTAWLAAVEVGRREPAWPGFPFTDCPAATDEAKGRHE